ncbi:SCO7613 C-terminal domain-containing membrane protein [Jidongwangia harbinensis]|uniref:SCO7613 C-terminal domain-containing membrane protein n=1 Tax=Jidongwangia harbinensis TaxID=2878561 RepID=UPI001CD99A25|nr:hypothetical protein [Jidongwangia harbinensis]MCA2218525.1 hypothetical protein [Jidongwangia harbinensis]
MTYPCPYCRTEADVATGCPGCGRGPDPDAAAVVRLDAEIGVLTARLAAARQAAEALDGELRDAWQRRHTAAARVRAAVAAAARRAAPAAGPASGPVAGLGSGQAGGPGGGGPGGGGLVGGGVRRPETSARLVQNALFLLGGLLLAVAAIVFTAVAWSQFGLGGRAALLAGFTAVALAVPPLALRRDLRATAETFAALGLLLVLLDGYAAWYVNLFGVADYSAYGYAGAVCAVTAAVAAGYEHVTGLAGPRYVALVIAQPVLPLLVAPLDPDPAGWSFTLAAVAALDVTVIYFRGRGWAGISITAYLCGLLSIAWSVLGALIALAVASTVAEAALGGTALVTAVLVVTAAAVLARVAVAQAVAGGLIVVALAVGGARVLNLANGEYAPVLIAALVAGLAWAAVAVRRVLPAVVRRGPWAGAVAVVVVPAAVTLIVVAFAASGAVEAAQPFLGADPGRAVERNGLQFPAVVALVAAAVVALLPVGLRRCGVIGGVAALGLTVPAGFGLAWWSVPAVDLLVVGAAVALAVRTATPSGSPAAGSSVVGSPAAGSLADGSGGASPVGSAGVGGWRPGGAGARAVPGAVVWFGAVAAMLVAHAVLTGFGRAAVAAATLGAVALIGTAAAALARPERRGDAGAVSLAGGLLAVPAAVWALTVALSVPAVWQTRAVLASAAALVVVPFLVHRAGTAYRRPAHVAVLLGLITAPLWALESGDSPGIYAAVALLLTAVTVPLRPGVAVPAALPLGFALVLAVAESVWSVLVAPYGWFGAVWDGRPAGVGLDPAGLADVAPDDTVAVALAALVAVVLRGAPALLWSGDGSAVSGQGGGSAVSGSGGGSVVSGSGGGSAVAWLRVAVGSAVPVVIVAGPMAVAAAGVRWPGVPAVSLLAGLAVLLTLALRPPARDGITAAVCAGVAALAAGAGLAGALPTHASTLAALGGVLVAGAVAGVAGRAMGVRIVGWLVAVVGSFGLAFTVGRAWDLALTPTAFIVLGAAAAALALGTILAGRRTPADRTESGAAALDGIGTGSGAVGADAGPGGVGGSRAGRRALEGRVVQAAAHAGAVVAVLLAAGSVRAMAVVCTLWGLALGVRALWPGERTVVRHGLVVAAAGAELLGWWLLVADAEVAMREAYTLPAAAVALLAGWLAWRRRRELSSWAAYGPALAAALLPTCASVLVDDGAPVRRLVLGLGALAVLLAGAYARLQAPVVAGGAVLAVTAVHELALVWDLLPRWIPLAVAGLLLVGLAMTLERRRRDLSRVRAALTRMN